MEDSTNRNLFRALLALMWSALPLTALRFWLVWEQLPGRMATHFDANWQPNGWMPRETALYFALGITAFMLTVFTVILLAMSKPRNTPAALRYGFLVFSYFIVGFVFYGNSKVVSYNLGEGSASIGPGIMLVPVALTVLAALYLGVKRGRPLPSSDLIAEEVHRSPILGLIMATLATFILLLRNPAGLRPALPLFAFISLLILMGAVSAWSGFHYLFSRSGLEIRTLGYRLRSIPVNDIVRYTPGTWPFWRGYGIRGLGSTRAYVWGNRGVWIDTPHGNVFLGHDNPQGIVRDLDTIKQSVH